MIRISNRIIDKTIRYLELNFPIDDDIYIRIAEGFEVVEDPKTGEKGFGAFHTDYKVICIASMMDAEGLVTTLAHEYRHAMQQFEGKEFDETDAEEFANMVLEDMKEKGLI